MGQLLLLGLCRLHLQILLHPDHPAHAHNDSATRMCAAGADGALLGFVARAAADGSADDRSPRAREPRMRFGEFWPSHGRGGRRLLPTQW